MPKERRKFVWYISGPMTGTKDMGRKRFSDIERHFTDKATAVLNPARLPLGIPDERYMPICIAMLSQADAVLMLNGWQESKGAKLEHDYAKSIGMAIFYENEIAFTESKVEGKKND